MDKTGEWIDSEMKKTLKSIKDMREAIDKKLDRYDVLVVIKGKLNKKRYPKEKDDKNAWEIKTKYTNKKSLKGIKKQPRKAYKAHTSIKNNKRYQNTQTPLKSKIKGYSLPRKAIP